MDLEFTDTRGREVAQRKAPVPPRRGDIVMLPPPFPEEMDHTAGIDAARYNDPEPFLVKFVIWDLLGQKVRLVVEPTELPPGLR